ncbi:uncharacterized protein LOC128036130 [Gossypium raimondii]|uniref:uncharacterized protein LOC128036130 n=1 Tax=Gossypium raimondii TaxID=29730 RepID=UPI00227A5B79|nr:uncharacterized protein LOC128036130 [Gossypium raimondii]
MSSSGFSLAPPPVFNGEGYNIWVVKMKTYMQAFDLWEVVNSDVEPLPLRANPAVAQIRQHSDDRAKRYKAMLCIQNSVSDVIFTRIMACESPKQAWDKLKVEFQGNEITRQQQLLNLRRDFENLKMKEEETVKQYSDRIMSIVNNTRLLGDQFSEARIVEKEQRRASRQEEHQEGVFQAKSRPTSRSSGYKGNKIWSDKPRRDGTRRKCPPCPHCRRLGHLEVNCWFKPDVQCKICKQMGHIENVCRNKGKLKQNQPQQPSAEAQVAEEGCDQEEQVFIVSCLAARRKAIKRWLIDSGYTNHMTPNVAIFKNIDISFKIRVKVGNRHFIKV